MASSFGFRLPLGGAGFGSSRPRQQQQRRQQRQRLRSSADAAAGTAPQQGLLGNPVLKSGLISGSLSLAGDILAQLLTVQKKGGSYDPFRSARMFTFGLCFYGPYQHWWYRLLDRSFGARTLPNFAAKITLNQLALAPLTISVAFAWNLALTGQLAAWPAKMRADFAPTIVTGWKFWVPAATVNFAAVPLQYQVLYMSTCGMIWTGYLSYSSAKK